MRYPSILALSVCLLFGACQSQSISYPVGRGGDLVRAFETGKDAEAKEAYSGLMALSEGSEREVVTPALLQIVGRDSGDRALWAAYLLSDWNPAIAKSAPEFEHLRPRVYRALARANDEDSKSLEFGGGGATFLLARMGPAAIRGGFEPMGRRFVAPVEKPIEGESAECWTRYVLGNLLPSFGARAAPVFVKGLDHGDPWVRSCSMNGLAALADLAHPAFPSAEFQADEKDIVPARAAARKALPKIVDMLCASDDYYNLSSALTYLAAAAEPGDVTPRLTARLLAVADQQSYLEVGKVLRVIYPAGSREFMRAGFESGEGKGESARAALAQMGVVIVPDLIARLGDAAQADLVAQVLADIETPALMPLLTAAHAAKDPVIRGRIAGCYVRIFSDAQRWILDWAVTLDTPSEPRMGRVGLICEKSPAAGAALPYLERLAASADADAALRKAARDAIVQITREQLPADPTK